MGHIELAAPAVHIWYLKGVPSPISQILDVSARNLEKVIYFASYIITKLDAERLAEHQPLIAVAVEREKAELRERADQTIRELSDEHKAVTLELAEARGDKEKLGDVALEITEEGATEKPAEDAEEQKPTIEQLERRLERLSEGILAAEASFKDQSAELDKGWELARTTAHKALHSDPEFRQLRRFTNCLEKQLGDEWEGVCEAGLGAEAVRELLREVDLEALAGELREEMERLTGPRQVKAIKRLTVVEAFLTSQNKPDWMVLQNVPVIPPDLRPMVQLDGGRFAASDLNDLYRRIINRNNRLRRIIDIKAPESIINHEKRLLQEAVDALIDNARRPRPVTGSNRRPLKSLSDMLRGKEGRFRKNLLGKRVDYSGRSVIVVGPDLQLHQCGLPKEMALELFKPFVMKRLVELQYTGNVKTAKRMVDRLDPAVWDALDDIIRQHPILLNRAPTLHRLGIQAFEPVLVDGKAIQIHPLVCAAFNADFDGDQMAVHVPLSAAAQAEARLLMLSTQNLFSPGSGRPLVAPAYDIVLGCYYLTADEEALAEGAHRPVFGSADAVVTAFEMDRIGLHEPIEVRFELLEVGTADETVLTRERDRLLHDLGASLAELPYGAELLRQGVQATADEATAESYRVWLAARAEQQANLMTRTEQPALPSVGAAWLQALEAAAEALAVTWGPDAPSGEDREPLDAEHETTLRAVLGAPTWNRLARLGTPSEMAFLATALADHVSLIAEFERRMNELATDDLAAVPQTMTVRLASRRIETTAGRVVFNLALPVDLRFQNKLINKSSLSVLIDQCYESHGQQRTVQLLEDIKRLGFDYATRAGVTISVTDLVVPQSRAVLDGHRLEFSGGDIVTERPITRPGQPRAVGKTVRVEVLDELPLTLGVAEENLNLEDGGDGRPLIVARGAVVVRPAGAELPQGVAPLELKPGDVLRPNVNQAIGAHMQHLRGEDPAAYDQLEAELTAHLRVCGRDGIVDYALAQALQLSQAMRQGLVTATERRDRVVSAWATASETVFDSMFQAIQYRDLNRDESNPLQVMADSGARGNRRQMVQLAGMRGLMTDPSGRIIEDLAITSNFREGLTIHEYFISTHGARKGLADTALRTADAGYLTRRMVDVAQDVIVREADCGTANGIPAESIWGQARRCDTCGANERHVGRHGLTAARFVEALAAELGLGEESLRRDQSTEVGYIYAFRPAKESDVRKYRTIAEGTVIGGLTADREYKFDQSHDEHGRTWLEIKPLGLERPVESLDARIAGRTTIEPIVHPRTGEVLVGANETIGDEVARRLTYDLLFESVLIRTAATCDSRRGICAKCYGRDMSTKRDVEIGEAVGIIAAQSIGEPGTQLTMRTFHTGGVAVGAQLTGVANVKRVKMEAMRQLQSEMHQGKLSVDELGSGERERNRAIQTMLKVLEAPTGGLLRVVELFEARTPKGEAITTDVDGIVEDVGGGGVRRVIIRSRQSVNADPSVFKGAVAADAVVEGRRTLLKEGKNITRRDLQTLEEYEHRDVLIRKEYLGPSGNLWEVNRGDEVQAGDRLTPGPLDPSEVLEYRGVKGVVSYIIQEIQKVYAAQGVSINDKHIEVVVRQMLRKREVVSSGDTDLLPGQKVDRALFEEENERVISQGGQGATARFIMLGITEASLATESFLSAASFQKTTRVLTEAAVQGREDQLLGLKENVIIGRLIPAGTGMSAYAGTTFDYDSVTKAVLQGHLTEPSELEREEDDELARERRFSAALGHGTGLDGMELLDLDRVAELDDEDEDEDDELDVAVEATDEE